MLKADRPIRPIQAAGMGSSPAPAPVPRTQHAISNRPSVAPGVSLIGEMRDSGFTDRSWLVDRGGRFIQVSELLYRVLERADGTHTLGEIASGITDATEWMISAEQVRIIIDVKLLPMGLIAPALPFVVTRVDPDEREYDQDGEPGDGPLVREATTAQPRSPLAVYARRRILAPRLIEPMTSVLQLLYAPPVVAVMLALIVSAQVWLFRVRARDVIAGLVQALETPGLLLAVLALVVIATLFHELGHASALRYGGGHVRGIGVGMYLYLPVFYSDVTDSYRLGRWARVRTDLGGFYFGLIFALGTIAVYAGTHLTFLLLLVVLIDFDVLYQCIPFVRMDGYWVVADLTGIPDLFTYMGVFLRSLLSIRRPQSHQASLRLKPWVKAVFALYTAVTIPLLALLWFSLVEGLPTLVYTTWQALVQQGERFMGALHAGAAAIMVLALIQAFLLAVTAVGAAYLTYGLAYKPARALWNWGGTSPLRFAATAAIALALLVGLALLWTR